MDSGSRNHDAVYAPEFGFDPDEYLRKKFELLSYHDDDFLNATRASNCLDYLLNLPEGVKVAETLEPDTKDDPPRPETYVIIMGRRDGTNFKESQIVLLVEELRHYIAGIGSPALGKRACRSRQSEVDAARIKKIDEAVPGDWSIERSTRLRESQRRYILTHDDCQRIRAVIDHWQDCLNKSSMPLLLGLPPRRPADSDTEYGVPIDFTVTVGATSTPRQQRRKYQLHLGDDTFCYLLDAICKVLFPGSGFGIHYFTLRLVHRRELMAMALRVDDETIQPWFAAPVCKAEDLVGPATDQDFERNYREVMRMGVMKATLTKGRNTLRKQSKRAAVNKAEHDSWLRATEAEADLRKKEREVVIALEG
ncbi:hypothetical protein CAC42_2564 [Sphaceloma murrayae]|uniref:Uncharacterized protein n=1 Tax=Sphaceloma murrayae TaxID=2082308 RepID=A0A2K1QWG4_9PEZI|nr:hypothetical protein CAC42_2564 [Sphaceloma murrayae]